MLMGLVEQEGSETIVRKVVELRDRLLGDPPFPLHGSGITLFSHLLGVELGKKNVVECAGEPMGCLVVQFINTVSDVLLLSSGNTT